MRSPLPACTLLVLLLALLSFGRPAPQAAIREDEVECEEAVAHLTECCSGFDPTRIRCEYVAPQGCSGGSHPELDVETSRAIRALSCADAQTTWCTYGGPGAP
jgi:hypothetical protein